MPYSTVFFSRRKPSSSRKQTPTPPNKRRKSDGQDLQEAPSTPLSKISTPTNRTELCKRGSRTWSNPLVTPPPRLQAVERMTDGEEGKTPMRCYFEPKRTTPHSPLLQKIKHKEKDARTQSSVQYGSEVFCDLKNQFAATTQFLRNNIYMVFLQHAFPTTASLVESFIKLGINPKNMFFIDKTYSTPKGGWEKIVVALGEHNTLRLLPPHRPWLYGEHLEKNIADLWERVIVDIEKSPVKPSKIIVIADGGRLMEVPSELLKYPIYGVEQTMHGHRHLEAHSPPFPWISVATCDMKRQEDALIGNQTAECVGEVLSKLPKDIDPKNMRFGIIGLGNVGRASAQALISRGYAVSFYDPDASRALEGATKCQNLAKLIVNCNFIIWCTGTDALKDTLEKTAGFHLILENKLFMSMSSEAIEFAAFMQKHQKDEQNMYEYENCIGSMHKQEFPIFPDLKYLIKGHTVTIINSGFPVNLQHDMKPDDIAITRTALLGAGMQWVYRMPEEKDKRPESGVKPTEFSQSFQDWAISLWQEGRAEGSRVPKYRREESFREREYGEVEDEEGQLFKNQPH